MMTIEKTKTSLIDHIKSLEGKKIEVDAADFMHLFIACSSVLEMENEISPKQRQRLLGLGGGVIDLIANDPAKAQEMIDIDKRAMVDAQKAKADIQNGKDPKEVLLESLLSMLNK